MYVQNEIFVKISEEQRQQICNSYRCEQSSSDLRRQFIICYVVKRSRKRNVDSGRNYEYTYSFHSIPDGK